MQASIPLILSMTSIIRLVTVPVTFAYKSDAQGTKHYGLVAEEVAAV
jgi:hypothetical protein